MLESLASKETADYKDAAQKLDELQNRLRELKKRTDNWSAQRHINAMQSDVLKTTTSISLMIAAAGKS